ncbi:RNA polymerase II transcription factor B subunit 1 [Thecaphora frezii]
MASASASTAHLHAAVAFSKIAGTLAAYHNQSLTWIPSSSTSSVAAFTIRYADIAGLQTSKQGAAQTALMIALANGAQVGGKSKVLLVFNAAPQTALDDREKFKNELANAIARNRVQQQQQQQGGAELSAAYTPGPESRSRQASVAPGSPATAAARSATPVGSRTASPAPDSKQAPQRRAPEGPVPKTDMELRISVLRSNPQLRSLHKDVVLSGAMQDAEFWSHPQRQALLRAERAMLEQRQGRNARLADPKPTPNEAGEMKLSITAELIRDLFEQFPVVARAFEENVPAKLDESAFWTRYFQSKLYHRLRTSARSAASEHIVQDDPIFDKYLEDEDDQLEPRRLHNPHDRLLDLASTEEDHQETGNAKDWTMRAGAERKTLPLMRRFNDHSQSLLDSALGELEEEARRARRRIVGGVGEEYDLNANSDVGSGAGGRRDPHAAAAEAIKQRYYREIEIEDLNETVGTQRVRLDVGELEGYLQSQEASATDNGNGDDGVVEVGGKRKRSAQDDGEAPRTMEQAEKVVRRLDERIQKWNPRLGEFRPAKGESEVAMKVMLGNVRGRTQGRGVNDLKTLPDALQKPVLSLQASTTEFLRQFWSCLSTSISASAEGGEGETKARKQRAVKMRSSLVSAQTKIQALLEDMEGEGGEDARRKVLVALGPTQQAVRKALLVPL